MVLDNNRNNIALIPNKSFVAAILIIVVVLIMASLSSSKNNNIVLPSILAQSVNNNPTASDSYNYISSSSSSSSSSDDSIITHSLSNPQAVLPPRIVMNYSNVEYQGFLLTYKYRDAESFGQLSPPTKILSIINETTDEFAVATRTAEEIMKETIFSPNNITIKNSSEIQFIIKNSPPILQPDSISITAYIPPPDLKAVKVLDVTTDASKSEFEFKLDNKGEYLILATATWLPDDDINRDEIGYAFYSWIVKVI
jgi:hypothetical protein